MNVDFSVVRVQREHVENILPVWIKASIDLDTTLSFGALRNGEIIAFILYTPSVDRQMTMVLQYAYVKKELRGHGIATKLLMYSEMELKKQRISSVFGKFMGSEEQSKLAYKFFLKLKFMPLSLNYHFMVYFMQDIKETEFYEKIGKLAGMLEHVKLTEELSKAEITRFVEMGKINKYEPKILKTPLSYPVFFKSGANIQASLNVTKTGEDILVLSDSYIMNGTDSKALPIMYASVLNREGEKSKDGMMLVLKTIPNNFYMAVKSIFGEPQLDYLMQEYIKLIK